jgi:hypothetical protein
LDDITNRDLTIKLKIHRKYQDTDQPFSLCVSGISLDRNYNTIFIVSNTANEELKASKASEPTSSYTVLFIMQIVWIYIEHY